MYRTAVEIGRKMTSTRCTLRAIANEYGISHNTVSRYIYALEFMEPDLFNQCKAIMTYNKSVAHIRGGEATKILHRRKRAKTP